MVLRSSTVSRRRALTHAGTFLAAFALPTRLAAQAASDLTADGFRLLRARTGDSLAGGDGAAPISIQAYAGIVPGPLLRVKRGEELRVRLVNELSEATAIHWHGVRAPNGMDGAPDLTQPPVAPGASFDYVFRPQDAGTFWYHAPWYDVSRRASDDLPPQAGRRLYGVLIVEEPGPAAVDREHVLVFDEWPAASDSRLLPAPADRVRLMANGAPSPDLAVKSNERVRLRLINAARARVAALRIDRHGAHVMAIDGQPSEPFLARDGRLILAPGNAIDVFVDATLAPGATASIMCEEDTGERPIARFVYEQAPPIRPVPLAEPQPLPANPLPARLDFIRAVRLDLALDSLLRPPQSPRQHRSCFAVARGRTVQLGLINRDEFACALHVHGHAVRLLDRLDDGWKPFWLNNVLIAAKQTVRIGFVADNPGQWLIECEAIGARNAVSATWFEVL
jgi:FtsP/CotA-like multicopper oxidase with cupredoxin domain